LLTGDLGTARTQQLVSAENGRRLTDLLGPGAEAIVEVGPSLVGPFLSGADLLARVRALGADAADWRVALQGLVGRPARALDMP
jgi:hypothetical protein